MAKAPTVITAGIVVSGRIEGAEDIEVFGAVKGSVHLDGDVFVDEQARVDADLEVNNLTVHGILVGNVTASDAIELASTARVIGDLTAPRVIVNGGALYRGTIDMGDIEDEIPGESKSSRGKSARGSSRSSRSAPARAARPEREEPKAAAKPEPKRPSRSRKKAPEPAPEPEPVDDVGDDDDEPELPKAAAKKKVAVKKRS